MNEKAMLDSLYGLYVGDCYGAARGHSFLSHKKTLWPYTDDTAMALCVTRELLLYKAIDSSRLARSFASEFKSSPNRGYGRTTVHILDAVYKGEDYQKAAERIIPMGSWGNGSAMRIAPLGAYFSSDLEALKDAAQKCAITTHRHLEGQVGALATSLASALLLRHTDTSSSELLSELASFLPDSLVKTGLLNASLLEKKTVLGVAAAILGNGSKVSCQDTVPFAIFAAFTHRDDYEGLLESITPYAVDTDTVCAIAGGIVGGRVTKKNIPIKWIKSCESLPIWVSNAYEDYS